MKTSKKILYGLFALITAFGFSGCGKKNAGGIKITIWASEGDKPFV